MHSEFKTLYLLNIKIQKYTLHIFIIFFFTTHKKLYVKYLNEYMEFLNI